MGIRRTLASLLAVPALAAALWFGAGPGHADEQSTLARIISWALSTPENRVTVGAVEGALSSDAVIRNLRIADRDGVWLTLDRAKFSWRRLALLSQRLEIDALEVDRLTLARRPERSETDREQAAGAPVLPASSWREADGHHVLRFEAPLAVIEHVATAFAGSNQDRLDGLTVDCGPWWFNLRPSNTEPLLRLNLESHERHCQGGKHCNERTDRHEQVSGSEPLLPILNPRHACNGLPQHFCPSKLSS
jgi:hypothetical protein